MSKNYNQKNKCNNIWFKHTNPIINFNIKLTSPLNTNSKLSANKIKP